VRDKFLQVQANEDIDIVMEGDAGQLAAFLYEKGVAAHQPVVYPRFGTAMVSVAERQVELVGARKESYHPHSRKPSTKPGTLLDDVLRRDFTINTLLENLHTGEVQDLTGKAISDIRDKIIRTPADPHTTFEDDPLRMLRAVRFATRLGFSIDPETFAAVREMAHRLHIVSGERIREEFVKILASDRAVSGLEMMREAGLLAEFAPELAAMHGITQNAYHIHDVWNHTMGVLEALPADSDIALRLAALMHDVGKPPARSVDDSGTVHFFGHEAIGARIARKIMHRLKFSNSETDNVSFLISMHMRVGEYNDQWSDTAVRRLIRDIGGRLEESLILVGADKAAANPEMRTTNLPALRAHIARVTEGLGGHRMTSPLSGREIMELLGVGPGTAVGAVKDYLEAEIIEGNLRAGDKASARQLVLRKYRENPAR